jgi:hypothetical protein
MTRLRLTGIPPFRPSTHVTHACKAPYVSPPLYALAFLCRRLCAPTRPFTCRLWNVSQENRPGILRGETRLALPGGYNWRTHRYSCGRPSLSSHRRSAKAWRPGSLCACSGASWWLSRRQKRPVLLEPEAGSREQGPVSVPCLCWLPL